MPTVKPFQFRPPAQQSAYQQSTYRPMQNPQQKSTMVGATPITYTMPQGPKVTTPDTVRPTTPAVTAFNQANAQIQASNGTYAPPPAQTPAQPQMYRPPTPQTPATGTYTPPAPQVPVQQTPAQMPVVQTPTPTPAPQQTPVQVYTPPAPAPRADQADYALWLASPEYQQWASQITNRPVGWDQGLYREWMQNRPASAAPAAPSPAPGGGSAPGGVGSSPASPAGDPYSMDAWRQGAGANWERANQGLQGPMFDQWRQLAHSEWANAERARADAQNQQRQTSLSHQEGQYRRNFPTATDEQIQRALRGDPMALYGLTPAAPQGPPPPPAPVFNQNPPRIFSTGGMR